MGRGLMFHYAHGDGHPVVQGSIGADDFQRILDRRKRLISAGPFLHLHERGLLEPGDEVLTFDDGLSSQWMVFEPILRERGLTAFWFVPTAPLVGVALRLDVWRWLRTVTYPSVEAFYEAFDLELEYSKVTVPEDYLAAHTYLTPADRRFRFLRDVVLSTVEYEAIMERLEAQLWTRQFSVPTRRESLVSRWLQADELQLLQARGHVIGSHSHSHPTTLASLTHEAQEIEYATSTAVLRGLLGAAPRVMSHPCNEYTEHGLSYLQGLGYVLGFRATPQPGEWGPLEVPRIDSADLLKEIRP